MEYRRRWRAARSQPLNKHATIDSDHCVFIAKETCDALDGLQMNIVAVSKAVGGNHDDIHDYSNTNAANGQAPKYAQADATTATRATTDAT